MKSVVWKLEYFSSTAGVNIFSKTLQNKVEVLWAGFFSLFKYFSSHNSKISFWCPSSGEQAKHVCKDLKHMQNAFSNWSTLWLHTSSLALNIWILEAISRLRQPLIIYSLNFSSSEIISSVENVRGSSYFKNSSERMISKFW